MRGESETGEGEGVGRVDGATEAQGGRSIERSTRPFFGFLAGGGAADSMACRQSTCASQQRNLAPRSISLSLSIYIYIIYRLSYRSWFGEVGANLTELSGGFSTPPRPPCHTCSQRDRPHLSVLCLVRQISSCSQLYRNSCRSRRTYCSV